MKTFEKNTTLNKLLYSDDIAGVKQGLAFATSLGLSWAEMNQIASVLLDDIIIKINIGFNLEPDNELVLEFLKIQEQYEKPFTVWETFKTELDFTIMELDYLPESIGNLINLKKLILKNKNLTSLPESIGNLENLKYLYLNGNPITDI